MDALARLRAALADRYRVERELGAGGMATVYLAEDVRHRRKVAVKVLRPELAHALGAERFLREIETTAALHHPHILPLYDSGAVQAERGVGEGPSFLYYVMPYVEGESLRDRLTREKQLPIDDALQIAREVSDALSYAHSRGVVHRDIKPENILLEGGHAMVADFGIARAVSAAGSESLTQTGMSVGTPAYMSPEQAVGQKDINGRSDLYSLGCVVAVSPNGKWVSYTGDEHGVREVIVASFPDAKVKRVVSRGGGTEARWARSGHELFFESAGQLKVVSVSGESDLQISEPRALFSLAGYRRARNRAQYDVAPGDQRFIMIKEPPSPPIPTVVLVENWFPELRAKVKP